MTAEAGAGVRRWSLVAAVGWLGCYALLTALSRNTPAGALFVGDIVYVVPVLGSAVIATLAARRAAGRHRLLWWVLAGAYVAQTAGETIYGAYDYLSPDGPPDVSAADVGYLTASALTLVAMLIGFGSAGLLRHFRGLLDVGLILVGVGGLGWQMLIRPQLTHAPTTTDLVSLAYPVLDIALIGCITIIGLGGHRRVPFAVRLVFIAGGLNALSDMVYTYLLIFGSYRSGGWLDVCFEAAATCSLTAAFIAWRRPEKPAEKRTFDRGLTLLPILVSTAATFTLVIFQKVRTGTVDTPTLVAGGVLFLAVLLRQYLFTTDRAALAEQLRHAVREQQRLADTDGLTGLYNRRYLTDRLGRHEDQTSGRPTGLMMIDLDHFKNINDTYGHPAGDAVLRATASLIAAAVRGTDLIARYGGEEFVVLLPDTTTEQTRVIAEAIRQRVAESPVAHGGQSIPVTASIGVAGHDGRPAVPLLEPADQALYEAKAQGRNRVCTRSATPRPTATATAS